MHSSHVCQCRGMDRKPEPIIIYSGMHAVHISINRYYQLYWNRTSQYQLSIVSDGVDRLTYQNIWVVIVIQLTSTLRSQSPPFLRNFPHRCLLWPLVLFASKHGPCCLSSFVICRVSNKSIYRYSHYSMRFLCHWCVRGV